MTVRGPLPAAQLGPVLMHEHVFFDLSAWTIPAPPHKAALASALVEPHLFAEVGRDPLVCADNLLFGTRPGDEAVAEQELRLLAAAHAGGPTTLVDVTLDEIGRDPVRLRALSERTGVHVVCGCGWYVQPTHPPYVAAETEEQLAARLVGEIRDGIAGTGVRPGIIGELGVGDGIHPDEAKVLRAAALASRETGLAITIHCPIPHERRGPEIVGILAAAGADPARVVLGHQSHTAHDVDYQRACLATGATVQFDRFGAEFLYESWGGYREPHDLDVVAVIAQLCAEGHAGQILLSHDVCYRVQQRAHGGSGYTHVAQNVVRWLAAAGVSEADLRRITVESPARLLAPAGAGAAPAAASPALPHPQEATP